MNKKPYIWRADNVCPNNAHEPPYRWPLIGSFFDSICEEQTISTFIPFILFLFNLFYFYSVYLFLFFYFFSVAEGILELSQKISEKKLKLSALRKWNKKSCLSAASGMAAHEHYWDRRCRLFICMVSYSIIDFCFSLFIYSFVNLFIDECIFVFFIYSSLNDHLIFSS